MGAASFKVRLLGVDIHVNVAIFAIPAVLSLSSHAAGRTILAIFLGFAVSLLVHELAHAVTARRLGVTAVHVHLNSMGGLTHFWLNRDTPGRRALVVAAGPAAGLALGAVVWLARGYSAPPAGSAAAAGFRQLLFVTWGWSLIQLLPIAPFDGAMLVHCALARLRTYRNRLTDGIGVAVALGVAAGCLAHGRTGLAVAFLGLASLNAFAAFHKMTPLGLANFLVGLKARTGDAPPTPRPPNHVHNVSCDVLKLIVTSADLPAADALSRSDPGVDPALKILMRAMVGDDLAAERELWQRYDEQPFDMWTRTSIVIWRAYRRDWDGIVAMLQTLTHLKVGAFPFALAVAYTSGAYLDGARVGEAVIAGGYRDSVYAYNVACCWARGGDSTRSFEALQRAVEFGWKDWAKIDADTDLDAVRALPAYPAWRSAWVAGDRSNVAIG